MTALEVVLLCATVASVVFHGLSIFASWRFFGRRTAVVAQPLPPASVLVPLCGAEEGSLACLRQLCRQDYPEYQLIFGVRDAHDSAVPLVSAVMAEFPERAIDFVISSDVIGENPKVNNLHNMLARARYEHLVILDSDIGVGPDYLRHVVPPLDEPNVGMVTALYRAEGAENLWSRFEAVGIASEFAPEVLVSRMLQGMCCAFGSTMALKRATLESIGGLRAIADYLADDFMLGSLIARSGREVRLARHVVSTRVPSTSFKAMVRHQLRWARATRIVRPMGYPGLLLTYGTVIALIGMLLDAESPFSIALFGVAIFGRWAAGWLIGVHWMKDRVLRRNLLLLPLRDVLRFVVWTLGLVGDRIEWRGAQFKVGRNGILARVS